MRGSVAKLIEYLFFTPSNMGVKNIVILFRGPHVGTACGVGKLIEYLVFTLSNRRV